MPQATIFSLGDEPDEEELQDFRDSLSDLAPTIEGAVAKLAGDPANPRLIADLFRALHTLKGDAALTRIHVAAELIHPLESLLARIRARDAAFTPVLGETLLFAVDRVEMAAGLLAACRPLDALRLATLKRGLDALAGTPATQLDAAAATLLRELTGFRPAPKVVALPQARQPSPGPVRAQDDLAFFHDLAMQLEQLSPLLDGRIPRTLELALAANEAAGRPVDPVQLEAAVYMHDLGMMLLPEALWLKPGALSGTDREALREHPRHGAGLLARMPGWEGAAAMVAQHHEMPDGSGYPEGLRGEAICAGARLLAIVDAFESVMQKHRHRGHARSLLRAIAEVNACERQFAPEWVGPFNAVVRKMIEG